MGLLALVIATAGCAALVGGDEPTLTPAEVPDPPTPVDRGTTVAPGVSTSGPIDATTLAEHHVVAVRGISYGYREEYREQNGENDTVDVQNAHRIVVENETVYRRVIPSYDGWIDGAGHHLVGYGEYADGSTLYRSWQRGDAGHVFQADPNPGERTDYARYSADSIERYLALSDPSIARIDVEGTAMAHFQISGANVSRPPAGDLKDYRVLAVVRADGFVKRLDVEYETTIEGETVAVEYSFSYRQVGTAKVTPPSWAEQARTAVDADGERGEATASPTPTDSLDGDSQGPG